MMGRGTCGVVEIEVEYRYFKKEGGKMGIK